MSGSPARVLIAPDARPEYAEAVRRSGAAVVDRPDRPDVLIWSRHGGPEDLAATAGELDSLRWVQLPAAGVEDFFRSGAVRARPDVTWTSAKGAYARPVAEHALTLVLALLRRLPVRIRADSWGTQAGETLHDRRVLIVGGGGIAQELARLLTVFDTTTVVVRRRDLPVEHAHRVLGMEHMHRELALADVVVLAAALTPETAGMFSEAEFARMRRDAVFVNVARGGLVVTEHLLDALGGEQIGAAGLDVTDPEPLPAGHPLWRLPNVIVTPHTADTIEMIVPLLAERIHTNLCRYQRGQELVGVVDEAEGY